VVIVSSVDSHHLKETDHVHFRVGPIDTTGRSGRNAPVAGVDVMPGVMIATVPVRVQIKSLQRVKDYLQSIQDQSSEMIAFEQYGLHNISKLDATIKEACDFTSLMVIQPAQQMGLDGEDKTLFSPVDVKEEGLEDGMQGYFSYPLVASCVVHEDAVKMSLTYNANVLSEARIQSMAHHFSHAVQQLVKNGSTLLGQTSLVSAQDMERIAQWNDKAPELVDECLHDVISREFPDREAIFTTAGSVTYKQLEGLSNKVANQLLELGVTEETMIPICFEKSAWAIIAMIGVLKAGGVHSRRGLEGLANLDGLLRADPRLAHAPRDGQAEEEGGGREEGQAVARSVRP
jgi:non-ribosomal peptide synthetase component F